MRLGGLVRPCGQGLRKPIDTFEINPSARMGRESAAVRTIRNRTFCNMMPRPPSVAPGGRSSHRRKGLTGSSRWLRHGLKHREGTRGDRGANLPQPDRGARIHDVLRTQAVSRRAGAPRASAFLVGTATVVGHFIPLSPFFFVGSDVLLGAVLAIQLSGVALFGIGWYEAKITVGSWWREGLEMLVIGLGGGVAGYVIGRLVGAA